MENHCMEPLKSVFKKENNTSRNGVLLFTLISNFKISLSACFYAISPARSKGSAIASSQKRMQTSIDNATHPNSEKNEKPWINSSSSSFSASNLGQELERLQRSTQQVLLPRLCVAMGKTVGTLSCEDQVVPCHGGHDGPGWLDVHKRVEQPAFLDWLCQVHAITEYQATLANAIQFTISDDISQQCKFHRVYFPCLFPFLPILTLWYVFTYITMENHHV